ncbi:MAG: hypothetical protein AAFR12_15595 [Cyanobacteria bacterium J06626_6]
MQSISELEAISLDWSQTDSVSSADWIRALPDSEAVEKLAVEDAESEFEANLIEYAPDLEASTPSASSSAASASAALALEASALIAVEAPSEDETELIEAERIIEAERTVEIASAEQPAERTTERTAERTAEQTAEQTFEQRADLLLDKDGLDIINDRNSRKDSIDLLSELLSEQNVIVQDDEVLDDELGTLRLIQLRSRENEELGILRLLQTAQATPPPPKPPIAFLAGRLGFLDTQNAFRSTPQLDEQIYQSGLTFFVFPRVSDNTSLYAIAETNLARYSNFESVDYNELEVQVGIRQRLLPRTFVQVGWRNQKLYSPGYRDRLFSVHYIDTLISHRSIINKKTWLDGFYQMRLGFADPQTASRLRQTFTLSLNYGISRDFRTSLLYQLDFDDYTQVSRFDTYQQVLGIISYNLTPESRLSFFGGTRFGRSSTRGVNLNDTFYGAGLNVSVPLF